MDDTISTYVDHIGTKHYLNSVGNFHREGGPAVIWTDGTEHWCINGKRHRIDGPSIIFSDKRQYWFINGKQYDNNKSFQKAADLTDEDMLMINLKFGDVK